jgi:hypothetical protein
MNSLIIIGVVVFVVLIILINSTDAPYSIDDHHDDIMKNYDEEKWIKYQKEHEEIFHHLVTGYSGTKSEMDTYIVNREKQMKYEGR